MSRRAIRPASASCLRCRGWASPVRRKSPRSTSWSRTWTARTAIFRRRASSSRVRPPTCPGAIASSSPSIPKAAASCSRPRSAAFEAREEIPMKSPAVALHDLGQSIWLDFISDGLIQSGELRKLIDAGSVYGVTSNPTIFKNAIAGDKDSYPAEIIRLAGAGKSAEEIFDELSARDITRTADLLLDAYRKGTGRDGFVSLEVPPALAYDTEGTIAEAKRLWAKIRRPNLFVKVPATPPCIPAIEALIADGISINVTLTFSAPQYVTVAEAFKRGIDRRIGAGLTLEGLNSVASIFVSRLDTSADQDLEAKAKSAQ